MCPDHQILSLYLDGELPSPWKEKTETHLVSCGECQIRLEQYNKLRTILEEDRIIPSPEQQNRVWEKIISGKPEEVSSDNGRRYSPVNENPRPVLWKRRVSLPFPAVAAAAAVFIIITFLAINSLAIQGTGSSGAGTGIVAGVGTDAQGIIPVTDMNGVLQYLSREETADYMIIRLPETRNFSSSGEPALLKAADYSRRTASR